MWMDTSGNFLEEVGVSTDAGVGFSCILMDEVDFLRDAFNGGGCFFVVLFEEE